MTSFRAEMIAKPPPNNVNKLINSLTPQKGIKMGENIVGTELLDEEEMGDEKYEEEEDESEELDTEQLLAALSGNSPIKSTSEEPAKESDSVTGKIVFLVG